MGINEVLAIALVALKRSGGGGGGGTSNYNDLSNLPQINSVTLQGNKSSDDLGIFDASELIALEFDETQDYPVGDVVIHEHGLYQFTTAHVANDPWDATEVQSVIVADLIPQLIQISQAEYDVLSYAEKHDLNKIYFIYDAGGGGGGGTDNYNDLSNKPQINSVTLQGNKSFDDLGLNDNDLEPSQLNNLLDMI